ncbi:MAG: alpha/beta hydrolase [Ruminococcaceae bacterium]|nr:alpha/beta hydrolase [Oscillospiraceae bacterium]
MEVLKKHFTCPSSDGIHTLSGVVFEPVGEIHGFFHVVHGMTEYIGRYERLMSDVAKEGYLAFGYDHLGHGKTVRDESELGFIASKDGYLRLCEDVKLFSERVMTAYGKGDRPYFLMGHSMGSFVVRVASEKYVTPDKLIVMGTGGPNPAAGAGLALIALIKRIYGERHISRLIDQLAFGGYNQRFDDATEEAPDPWLTTDLEVRKKYAKDPLCSFRFTVSAMGDLMRLLKTANRGAWYKNLPRELPILLVSGREDPVGGFGKGVETVYRRLQRSRHCVRCILYEGARHEILNDFTYEDAKRDILAFCEEKK